MEQRFPLRYLQRYEVLFSEIVENAVPFTTGNFWEKIKPKVLLELKKPFGFNNALLFSLCYEFIHAS